MSNRGHSGRLSVVFRMHGRQLRPQEVDMTHRSLLVLSSAILMLGALDTRGQDLDTMRAVPDPEADLPDAVTQQLAPPDAAAEKAVAQSEGRRGSRRRNAGLETAPTVPAPAGGSETRGTGLDSAANLAADAAADALLAATEAAEMSREAMGRGSMPDSLPSPAAELPDAAP